MLKERKYSNITRWQKGRLTFNIRHFFSWWHKKTTIHQDMNQRENDREEFQIKEVIPLYGHRPAALRPAARDY